MRWRIIIIFLIVLFIANSFASYAQTSDGVSSDIFTKLKAFSSKHITEKVYLHFDKPYYASGDTIYFKAYATMGERLDLSRISGVLHVDLINAGNKIDQSVKLQLINGLAWGDFALPDSLPIGNYRIRAYTQWMRNDANYFEQSFPIGSVHNLKIPESGMPKTKATIAKPDLQFFPEGGDLVVGIKTKVAFKAISNNGLGIAVNGKVIDNSGKVISEFASAHLGMGSFNIEPEEGKTYKADLTFADGTKSSIDLPLPHAKGIMLTINNDSIPNAAVRICANNAYFQENKGKEFSLLIYSGGIATAVDCILDIPVISFDIIKRRLHTGVARVTLFSSNGEPLCERLLFIQNYDQLKLDLASDKMVYALKEKVSIKLSSRTRADSATMGHFSVSVIDERKVPVDEASESTILTNLLLTSELKGTVEQPNYYFTNLNDEASKNLDLVMLTHGYHRFEWKQVLNTSDVPLIYQPEKGLAITGTAENLLGRPLRNASVSLISLLNRQLISTTADSKGKFSFNDLFFADSASFILQATNAKGRNNTQLVYDEQNHPIITKPQIFLNESETNQVMAPYLENSEKQQEEIAKFGSAKGKILKEVKIRAIKEDNQYPSSNLGGPGHADQVVHRDELEKIGGTLMVKLAGKFHGIFGWTITSGNWGGLVVVDGATMGPNYPLDNINPNDVETVELLTGANAAIYGMQGGHGVLVITTRVGSNFDSKDIASIGILPIKVLGFHKAREFYSPKYESDITSTRPDLRSTIYWNPEVITDKGGNALFDYYNADGHGSYRVVVEGIDDKGNLGRQVYRYRVD